MNYEVLQKAVDLFPDLNLKDEQFDMGFWRFSVDGKFTDFNSKNDCGTAGCFLGWFPLLDDEVFKPIDNDFWDDGTLDFPQYGERILSLDSADWEWCWLFDSSWGGTLSDAILRAKYLIKNKIVPSNFIDYDMKDYDFTNL